MAFPTTTLGASGKRISAMCLGAMMFGTTVPEARGRQLLERFVERGGNFLDTANNYAFWAGGTGDESETVLGRWVTESGLRDQLVLATKLGARPAPGTSSFDHALGLSATAVSGQLRDSLARLGVDRVDLLYLHIDDPVTRVAETQRALADQVAVGTVDALGTSNHTLERMRERDDANAALGLRPHDAIQMRHSYLTPRTDADFAPQVVLTEEMTGYAAEVGTTVCAYGPLLNGALTRDDRDLPAEYQHERTAEQVAALRAVAAAQDATPNQVVLAWMLAQHPIVVPVVGTSRIDQLDEALDAAELSLTEDDLGRLAAARGRL